MLTWAQWSTTVDGVIEKVPDPSNPVEALAAVVSLRRLADRLEAASVQAAIDQGWNWVQIAEALGVTKQAVHKKYARRIVRRTTCSEGKRCSTSCAALELTPQP